MLDSLPERAAFRKKRFRLNSRLSFCESGDASRAQDQQTLKNLQTRFGALMKGTPSEGVFRLLTGAVKRLHRRFPQGVSLLQA